MQALPKIAIAAIRHADSITSKMHKTIAYGKQKRRHARMPIVQRRLQTLLTLVQMSTTNPPRGNGKVASCLTLLRMTVHAHGCIVSAWVAEHAVADSNFMLSQQRLFQAPRPLLLDFVVWHSAGLMCTWPRWALRCVL